MYMYLEQLDVGGVVGVNKETLEVGLKHALWGGGGTVDTVLAFSE